MRKKIHGFIYPGVDLTEFEAKFFFPPSFGPTLMARGSFGTVRLAVARQIGFVPRNLNFWIWWIWEG